MEKNIHGEYLDHLRFAENIALILISLDELQVVLNNPNRENIKIDLKVNRSKTK